MTEIHFIYIVKEYKIVKEISKELLSNYVKFLICIIQLKILFQKLGVSFSARAFA